MLYSAVRAECRSVYRQFVEQRYREVGFRHVSALFHGCGWPSLSLDRRLALVMKCTKARQVGTKLEVCAGRDKFSDKDRATKLCRGSLSSSDIVSRPVSARASGGRDHASSSPAWKQTEVPHGQGARPFQGIGVYIVMHPIIASDGVGPKIESSCCHCH